MNKVKKAYERLQRWKRNKASEKELKAAQQLAVMEKQLKAEESKALIYSKLALTEAKLMRAKAIVREGQHHTSKLKMFADKLQNVNQRFQNVDSEFGRVGAMILGTPAQQQQAQYRTIRKEGYVHPADRVMGFKAPISTHRVKVKAKAQPIQIQVIQSPVRAKKRKPQGRMVYEPLWGYVRR